jgi:DNA-directed RNA polymerase specialized sigma subunit
MGLQGRIKMVLFLSQMQDQHKDKGYGSLTEIGKRHLPEKIRIALEEYFDTDKTAKEIAKKHSINYGHFTQWINRVKYYDAEEII